MAGLYFHWPFCLSKCPYCDFNSHPVGEVDHAAWRQALLAELDYGAATMDAEGPVDAVFFGGGTPSLMEPATVAALLERAESLFGFTPTVEITLEANPGTVDAARFRDLRAAGINRLSLGIQSLDDDSLKFLERRHSAAEAKRAIVEAAAIFPRRSFDLIYARPGQTAEAWRRELREAIALAGGHLSLYQLTIEQGTRFFADHARGAFAIPDEDRAVDLWEVTQEETARAGLLAYEISNHARPGEECRHNVDVWEGGSYLGIGPGAHGRIRRNGVTYAVRRHRAPELWLKAAQNVGHGTREDVALTPDERAEELLLLGLRLTKGIDADVFYERCGRKLNDVIDSTALATLKTEGWIEPHGRLRTTNAGRLCLNTVIKSLIV